MGPLYRVAIGLLLVLSCQSKQQERALLEVADGVDYETAVAPMQSPEASDELPDPDIQQPTQKKKIIKDGRMGLNVAHLDKTKGRIDSLVKAYGGYYENENFGKSNYEKYYDLRIRVPNGRFEALIAGVESGEQEVVYKEIDARDVTDQFIDLETRLENKRNYLTRYRELLKKAGTVKEILEIEEKIRGLEEEIESTEGRLKYLSDLVAYSVLNLRIATEMAYKYRPARRDSFFEQLKQSLSKGWYGFVDFLLLMIKIWPFWILVAVSIVIYKKVKKRK